MMRRIFKLGAWSMALVLLVSVSFAFASSLVQTGEGYNLSWWTVDGGGETLSDGAYTLRGTAGQPDAGVLRGGDYTLAGGFWAGGIARYEIYLPLVLRNVS